MPRANRTLRPLGTETVPSPNAKTITPARSGKPDSCSNNHRTFLFASVSDAPPVRITNASVGKSRCLRQRFLSCGLNSVVSIPGGITCTPPQALTIGLRLTISASQWLFATMRAPHFGYARIFRECAAFASNRFAGHLKIGHGSQGCVSLAYRSHPR